MFTDGADDTQLLFIQRAVVDGDPWSGQMAFPGGRFHEDDADSFATAERETKEELGLDLSGARRLGSLGDVDGGRGTSRQVAAGNSAPTTSARAPSLRPVSARPSSNVATAARVMMPNAPT